MNGRPDGGQSILDALADGIGRRADERRRAEERLADFAFTERTAGRADSDEVSGAAKAAAPGAAWRYHVGRTLRIAGDPAALALLARLRDGPLGVALVAAGPPFEGDRVAAADWLGGLAAAGFVTREMEADRVAMAPLGAASLALVEALEGRLAVRPGDGPGSR